MKPYRILILVLAVALAASACVKLGGKPVDKRYYQLSPERAATTVAQPRGETLKVRRLAVSDVYNTRELVYRGPEGSIDSDFYNLFFVTPGNMLTTELRRWLTESGLFTHIVAPGSLIVPGLTLEGMVNALYGDYSGPAPAAVVEMQFFLVDESSAENDIVFSGSYKERVSLDSADPQKLILAMTVAVANIYTNLENDLAVAPLKN
ncbi:ABC-type transport auxiliary lipoprotein family protein [Pseudodesulfovibrio indicus]|uniref:ABC-type transport auxiliary lipoprotein family protein n=1 Tax=Pseudodesulfovibrio indicus TaxID=1716143 RepID=UPI00292FCD2F|nr:ABC-type transport auxiliary lipoprotein family protein [Pseudodesulfovibrio indicus]